MILTFLTAEFYSIDLQRSLRLDLKAKKPHNYTFIQDKFMNSSSCTWPLEVTNHRVGEVILRSTSQLYIFQTHTTAIFSIGYTDRSYVDRTTQLYTYPRLLFVYLRSEESFISC